MIVLREVKQSDLIHQPVRVAIPEFAAFGFERITCSLPDAPADVALEYRDRYIPNRNPAITALAPLGGAALDDVPAGAAVRLEVAWSPESVEAFPVLDRAAQALVDHRESMRASWFATAGAFASDRTGRAEDEAETFTQNTWVAPGSPGVVHLWVMLRDSRGGVDLVAVELSVR